MASQWSNTNDSANSVKWVAESLDIGSGKANQVANNTSLFNNTTPEAFKAPGGGVHEGALGQFGVQTAAMANTSGESKYVTHAGWTIRRAGMGPVTGATGHGSGYTNGAVFKITAGTGAVNTTAEILTTNSTGGILTIGNIGGTGGLFPNTTYITTVNPNGAISAFSVLTNGAGYVTGDVITISNGSVNAIWTITANSQGNISSVTSVSNGSGFPQPNAQIIKTVASATGGPAGNGVTSVTVSVGGTTYVNGDIVTFSNTNAGVVNATGTITTNTTGGITSVTVTAAGRGLPGATNTAVGVTNSTGGATTGSGATLLPVETSATFAANADSGTNANLVFTLGGRAGRVNYETIVAMSSIGHGAGSNTTQLPIT